MGRRIERLAVVLPDHHPLYRTAMSALKSAFEQLGVSVIGHMGMLAERGLSELVREHCPQAVLEINRSRAQVPTLSADVAHVCWMVDSGSQPLSQIRGSEVTYFFGANWWRRYPHRSEGVVDWLAPGFCPLTFQPGAVEASCDLSFAGHIPRPWNAEELGREVYASGAQSIPFGRIVDCIERGWPTSGTEHKNFGNDEYLEWALGLVAREIGVARLVPPAGPLYYDIACRLIRGISRRRMLDLAVAATMNEADVSLELYGSPNLLLYPAYAPYYRRFVEAPAELRALYQGSRLNLHEGVGPHFRTFDCMGSGGVVFFMAGPDDDEEGGMNHLFEPGVHYVPFDRHTFRDELARYTNDHALRKRVGMAAAKLVHDQHTWGRRAQKILSDLGRC